MSSLCRGVATGLVCAASLAGLAIAQNPKDVRTTPVVQVVKKVGPAIVNVSTETIVENPYGGDFIDPFEFFFGGARRPSGRQMVPNSLGSGVIVDSDGYVLTNQHVVSRASKITLTLNDGRQVPAKLVGSDTVSDIAVLKLQGAGPWPAVAMGSSDDLMIGEPAIAIGNPFGLQNTVTAGVISAVGRSLDSPDDGEIHYTDFVQTDAAINPGNSGGALLNALGELVGINSAINPKAQNIGFAIPIDRARAVYREILRFGRVRATWTGLRARELNEALAADNDLKISRGLYVTFVAADGPAAQAGIKASDIIVEAAGQKVGSNADLDTAIAKAGSGGSVVLKVIRGQAESLKTLRVVPFPREKAPQFARDSLGMSVVDGRNGAAIIDKVMPGSWWARNRVQGGQFAVLEVNGKEIGSAKDFYDAIPDAADRSAVSMVITDGRRRYNVTVPVR